VPVLRVASQLPLALRGRRTKIGRKYSPLFPRKLPDAGTRFWQLGPCCRTETAEVPRILGFSGGPTGFRCLGPGWRSRCARRAGRGSAASRFARGLVPPAFRPVLRVSLSTGGPPKVPLKAMTLASSGWEPDVGDSAPKADVRTGPIVAKSHQDPRAVGRWPARVPSDLRSSEGRLRFHATCCFSNACEGTTA